MTSVLLDGRHRCCQRNDIGAEIDDIGAVRERTSVLRQMTSVLLDGRHQCCQTEDRCCQTDDISAVSQMTSVLFIGLMFEIPQPSGIDNAPCQFMMQLGNAQ